MAQNSFAKLLYLHDLRCPAWESCLKEVKMTGLRIRILKHLSCPEGWFHRRLPVISLTDPRSSAWRHRKVAKLAVVLYHSCLPITSCFDHISASEQNAIAGGHTRCSVRPVQPEQRRLERYHFGGRFCLLRLLCYHLRIALVQSFVFCICLVVSYESSHVLDTYMPNLFIWLPFV